MPTSAAGRPHSSSQRLRRARDVRRLGVEGDGRSSRASGNSALQSSGSRSLTNASSAFSTFSGSWPGTSRQVIFTDACEGMTVLVPTP